MANDAKFDFSLDELATDQETAQEEELRMQIQKSAGNILTTVKKLANQGDLDNLRRIERSLTEAPEQRRAPRDNSRDARSNQQPTTPAAPATEPTPAEETTETKPHGRVAKIFSRINQ